MASFSPPVGSVLYAADAPPVLQNRMFDSRDAAPASPTGAMRLAQDPATGLVRNAACDPALLVYDESHQNEQAHGAAFQEHLRETADRLEPLAGRRVVEIGCGKDRFLACAGIEVVAPETAMAALPPGTRIAVANPNYLPEIAAFVGDRFPCAAL